MYTYVGIIVHHKYTYIYIGINQQLQLQGGAPVRYRYAF